MLRLKNGLRVTAIGVAGVLACTALTACGSDGANAGGSGSSKSPAAEGAKESGSQGDDGAAAVKATYQKTNDAKTARMVLRTQTTADGKSMAADGQGVIDLAGGNSEMTMTAEGQKIEQRVVDMVLFQKLPPEQRAGVPGKKPWIKIDLKKVAQQQGGGSAASNPADSTAYTKSISEKDVKKLGTEKIGDANTTRYRVVVDVDKLANGAQLKQQIGPTLPMEIWIDDDGRLRRQQTDMTLTAPKGTGADSSTPKKVKVRTVMELSDFGTKVDVKAPAAGEAADMTDKAQQQQKS